MRLLVIALLVGLPVSMLGCGSGTGVEVPENPDPMPTEQPIGVEQPGPVAD